MSTIKKDAKRVIERLPENATWDDLMYELYVTKKIEVALDAVEKGKIVTHKDVKKRFLGQ